MPAARIVVAAEDPGAANALIPVVRRLQQDGRARVDVIARRHAVALFRQARVKTGAALKGDRPALVLTGTSEAFDSIDRKLIDAARARGIRTAALLDYWGNYAVRFSGRTPRERFRYLPDRIFVMDAFARRAMLAEGFPAEKVVVTGSPFLEGLAAESSRPWPVPRGRSLITFASETFGWTHDATYRFPPLAAERERTVLILRHVLCALAEVKGVRPYFVNKLHPKNRPSEFRWLRRLRLPFPVRCVGRTHNAALLSASRLVIGMTSMLLREALVLGTPALFVVPRPAEESLLGGSIPSRFIARDPTELRRRMRALLKGHPRLPGELSPPGALDRVVSEIYRMLEPGPSVG